MRDRLLAHAVQVLLGLADEALVGADDDDVAVPRAKFRRVCHQVSTACFYVLNIFFRTGALAGERSDTAVEAAWGERVVG